MKALSPIAVLEEFGLGGGERCRLIGYRGRFFVLFGREGAPVAEWQTLGPYETQAQAEQRAQTLGMMRAEVRS